MDAEHFALQLQRYNSGIKQIFQIRTPMTARMPEQALPLGVSDFASLRQDRLVYVDKTEMIARLAATPKGKFFLARPRRFGKSLLVSTFESLFRHGLRDFRGLAIESQWTDKTHDVVRLDFSKAKNFSNAQEFREQLISLLVSCFSSVGFSYCPDTVVQFEDQLSKWLEERPASFLVLLIDEYDAPLTACLDQPKLFETVRQMLARFYAVLKSNDAALRFLFITGITKYSKVSIFSELNNLDDITLNPLYGTLLGYTEEEVNRYFGGYVKAASETLGMPADQMLGEMRRSYDGYCFDELASTHVYSPWSTLCFLKNPLVGLKNYWIESGGQTSLLTNYVRGHSLKDPASYNEEQILDKGQLSISADISTLNDVVLLMQAGYLTIKRVSANSVYLGYPNQEVAQSLAKYYTALLFKGRNLDMIGAGDIIRSLQTGDVETFVSQLNTAFLTLDYKDYPVTNEASCRAFVSVFLNGAGLPTRMETHNALGRSDLEFTVGDMRWVLEFKYAYDKTRKEKPESLLKEGLDQIDEKMYGRQSGEKWLRRVSLVFSEKRRQIVEFEGREPIAL